MRAGARTSGLTPRDRVLKAMRRERPDLMPWMLTLSGQVARAFRARHNGADYYDYHDFPVRHVSWAPSTVLGAFSACYKGRTFAGQATPDPDWGLAWIAMDRAASFSARQVTSSNWRSPREKVGAFVTTCRECTY